MELFGTRHVWRADIGPTLIQHHSFNSSSTAVGPKLAFNNAPTVGFGIPVDVIELSSFASLLFYYLFKRIL